MTREAEVIALTVGVVTSEEEVRQLSNSIKKLPHTKFASYSTESLHSRHFAASVELVSPDAITFILQIITSTAAIVKIAKTIHDYLRKRSPKESRARSIVIKNKHEIRITGDWTSRQIEVALREAAGLVIDKKDRHTAAEVRRIQIRQSVEALEKELAHDEDSVKALKKLVETFESGPPLKRWRERRLKQYKKKLLDYESRTNRIRATVEELRDTLRK